MIFNIESYKELLEVLSKNEKTYALLFKSGSELSECALNHITDITKDSEKYDVFLIDVSKVRDVHGNYNVTSVPSLLVFENSEYKNIIKGCMSKDYYNSLFGNIIYSISDKGEKKISKRVTIYTSPTCSWCNTTKSYLRKNNINFKEIDVSKNQKAAEELVRRSGQQGVPQTDINGQIVVGFDQKKIDRLLGINQ